MQESKKFSREEIAKIFNEASRLKAERSRQENPTEGLTRREIREIASDLDIDVDLIELAISKLHESGEADRFYFWGAPLRVEAEEIFPHRVSEEELRLIFQDIRNHFRVNGKNRITETFWEWHYPGEYRNLSVRGYSGEESTAVEISGDYRKQVYAVLSLNIFYIPYLWYGISVLLVESDIWSLLAGSLAVFVSFLIERWAVKKWMRYKKNQLTGLLQNIANRFIAGDGTGTKKKSGISVERELKKDADKIDTSRGQRSKQRE